ncbi:MAG: O-antigen ligase family protein [Acidobacteria bacterium]|nr:O-antigen ligase family protein [Acidobacteriota bacterium]
MTGARSATRRRHDSRQLLLGLMRLGVYVIPFLPLYVSTSLLFPYVTGRNFAFRILIELLLVPWAALAWLTRTPRRWPSPTTVALVLFVSWIALADALGANPYRSVWSTYERMAGLLGLVHLVLFFFILKAALKSLADWTRYFHLSIAASSLVALLALFQYGVGAIYGNAARPYGTIGNPGPLAGYLLLHVFVCALLLTTERRLLARTLLMASVCLELMTIVVSGTRSAILALALVCPALVVLAAWRRRRWIRSLSTPRLQRGLLLVAVLAAAALLLLRHLPLSGNFARPTVGTGQSPRLTLWITTLGAVRERLWAGWGQENFYMLWERHYVATEGYWDRAHNVLLEWLSAGGIPALALFVAIGACVAGNIRSIGKRTSAEALALGGFVSAYVIFNMFWFDTFETSFLLISVMAFADWRAAVTTAADVADEEPKAPVRRPLAPWAVAAVTAIVLVPAAYVLTLRPLFLAHDVIAALNAWNGGGPLAESRASFEKAFSYPGLRSQEAIEKMAALVPYVVATRAATEPGETRRFVDRAIRELTALTASPAVEARHLQMLGTVYTSASALEPSYRPLALDSFVRALAISPNNEQIYAGLSDFYAAGGDFDQALAMMRTAATLAPYESELQMALAPLALRTGKPADAELETFRVQLAAEKNLGRLAAWYLQTGDLEIARIVLEEMRKRDPANQQILEQYRTVVEWLKEGRGATPK